jgi:hypothetical protein
MGRRPRVRVWHDDRGGGDAIRTYAAIHGLALPAWHPWPGIPGLALLAWRRYAKAVGNPGRVLPAERAVMRRSSALRRRFHGEIFCREDFVHLYDELFTRSTKFSGSGSPLRADWGEYPCLRRSGHLLAAFGSFVARPDEGGPARGAAPKATMPSYVTPGTLGAKTLDSEGTYGGWCRIRTMSHISGCFLCLAGGPSRSNAHLTT